MGDTLLCLFHCTKDEADEDGCLSIYYAENAPILSYNRYSIHNGQNHVLPFSVITNVVVDSEDSNKISIYMMGQPIPISFRFSTFTNVTTFFQITVANGILKASSTNQNAWIPSNGSRPSDPVDWIIQNSNPHMSFDVFHNNSLPPYNLTVMGTSFSEASHREIIRNMAEKGRKSPLYQKLKNPFDEKLINEFYSEKKLKEYLLIRNQWESRITHQLRGKSKHNTNVDKLSKDLIRTISSEKTLTLIFNVLRTMITFAPDLGFVQGMVDMTLLIAELVLDDIQRFDDKAQSAVFWALDAFLFQFKQSRWYLSMDSANSYLIDDICTVMSSLYPAVGSFISYNDYEMFKHISPVCLTMLYRTLPRELLLRLLTIAFTKSSVNALYSSVIAAIFIVEFPTLSKCRVPDINAVARLLCDEFTVRDEDEFLAIISQTSEIVPPDEEDAEPMALVFKFFKPLDVN